MLHIFSSFFKNKICQNYLFVFRYVCTVCDSQWRNKSNIGVCAKFTKYGVIKIHDKSAFLVLFQVNGDNAHSFLTVTQLVHWIFLGDSPTNLGHLPKYTFNYINWGGHPKYVYEFTDIGKSPPNLGGLPK